MGIAFISFIVGFISIFYGVFSFYKNKITIGNYMVTILDVFSWWKKPSTTVSGNKSKIISIFFILFGLVAILNSILIFSGVITYP
jgi:hypothetical protein